MEWSRGQKRTTLITTDQLGLVAMLLSQGSARSPAPANPQLPVVPAAAHRNRPVASRVQSQELGYIVDRLDLTQVHLDLVTELLSIIRLEYKLQQSVGVLGLVERFAFHIDRLAFVEHQFLDAPSRSLNRYILEVPRCALLRLCESSRIGWVVLHPIPLTLAMDLGVARGVDDRFQSPVRLWCRPCLCFGDPGRAGCVSAMSGWVSGTPVVGKSDSPPLPESAHASPDSFPRCPVPGTGR
jgi:hypothetical protein